MVFQSQTILAGIAFVASVAAVPASAQTTTPAPLSAPSVVPQQSDQRRLPVARQIEPMVAAIKRAIPGAPKRVVPLTAAALTTSNTPPSPISPTPAPTATAIVAAPVILRAPTPIVARPNPPKQPKFVAYTCRIGQDYSVQRKACVTAGATNSITTAPSAKQPAKPKQAVTTIDQANRSALGLKPKL